MASPQAPAARDPDEAPQAGRRELVYALLAILGVLIGLSRVADPRPPAWWIQALDVGIALAFLGDWIRRVRAARRRGRYALRNAYEILTFIPFTLVPQLEGANVLRGVRLLRVLRFARFGLYAKVGIGLSRYPRRVRYVQRVVRHAQLVAIVLVGVLIVAMGAVALLVAEGRQAGLTGFEGALWWSLNLFTTVSYAIPSPTTPAGYAISSVLMVLGVAFLGVFTASLANALLRTPEDGDDG